MLKIDFYVQHLVRHNASGIELVSGKPVKFLFPTGDRQSNKPIEHAQVVQLVQEAASPAALEALRNSGTAEFLHKSVAGLDVHVQLSATAPGTWKVRLLPSTERAPKQASLPEAAPATAPPRGAQASPQGPPPVETIPDEPAINRYLRQLVAVGGSDLHLSSDVPPMLRVDGTMKRLDPNAPPLAPDELLRLLMEITPDPNKEEYERTNDTDFAHTIEGVARFRANVFTDRKGPGAVFRQIPFDILTVEQIGIPEKVLDLCWLSKGLVLVTGPTGSGKSTTLATLVDYINQHREEHIITIEDPIEFVHDNKKCLVNQREIGTHTDSFKKALRAALREDPDIVLVGEMRDLETIAIAIETAETGHLVFGTLHTTTAPSTVDRIIDQFPPDQQEQIRVMLSESLRGVISQVLCKKIGGGRVAGYEVLISNSAVSNLIREGKTYQLKSVMQTGKRLGMQTMNDCLLEYVKGGRVAPEEAYIKSNDKALLKQAFKQNNIPLNIGSEE